MNHTFFLTLFILLLPLLISCTKKQVYIVYLGEHNGEKSHDDIEKHHFSFLSSLKDSEETTKNSLVYSYKHSINGFAAELTPDEVLKLSELDEVVSVFASKAAKLQTTRSWDFLGVRKGGKRNDMNKNDLQLRAKYGKRIIVGMLDSGIWPESKSFKDKGMSPIPKRWKGICQHGDSFNSSHCNKKIIGARYYLKGIEKKFGPINNTYRSPRDSLGHGTHTSSIVGGRPVHAKLEGGFAHGTASGGAPLVHLAVYKVCWPQGCFSHDVLAAFDDAIYDGVDILSVSIRGESNDYASDAIAIGSLHAVKNNIFVSSAAGNNGSVSSVSNTAPWMITVGASSIDRAFVAPLFLGSGIQILGESMTSHKLVNKMYPLVYGGDVEKADAPKSYSGLCLPNSLVPRKTKGKIVFCWLGASPSEEVKRVGGVGLIYANTLEYGEVPFLEDHALPTTAVGYTDAQRILKYIYSTQEPLAYINPSRTALNIKPAPCMTKFSSKGPSLIVPDILKPDITAPGLNILAAWTEAPPLPMKYNIIYGTSMACPHVTAVAALIKAIHPTWSSAAIRSAIMTTAVQTNNMKMPITDVDGKKADPFSYGSGHLHPVNAADPGLIYDASYTDYLMFLCSTDVKAVTKIFKCPPNPPSANNLNYPSISISKLNGSVTIKRVVTNVGYNGTTYISQVEAPAGVYVTVSPSRLKFSHPGEKKSFMITVAATRKVSGKIAEDDAEDNYVFGSYTWSDGIHVVYSPMAINLA